MSERTIIGEEFVWRHIDGNLFRVFNQPFVGVGSRSSSWNLGTWNNPNHFNSGSESFYRRLRMSAGLLSAGVVMSKSEQICCNVN